MFEQITFITLGLIMGLAAVTITALTFSHFAFERNRNDGTQEDYSNTTRSSGRCSTHDD